VRVVPLAGPPAEDVSFFVGLCKEVMGKDAAHFRRPSDPPPPRELKTDTITFIPFQVRSLVITPSRWLKPAVTVGGRRSTLCYNARPCA